MSENNKKNDAIEVFKKQNQGIILSDERVQEIKERYENKEADENVRMQIAVLDYLLFRFMNNSIRKYIPTKELQSSLINQRHTLIHFYKIRQNFISSRRIRIIQNILS